MEEQIGALLRSAPHIVERILRHLSARDIIRVARVCRLWRNYGRIVLLERSRIVTMTATKQNEYDNRMAVMDNLETKEFLRNLDMKCGLMIMFQEDLNGSSYNPCVANFEAVSSCLPPSVTVVGARSDFGIIGTSTDGSLYEQQSSTECLSAFLLPKSPPEGTHIKHFSLSSERAAQMVKSEPSMAALAEAFKWPEDQVIKCIILLATRSLPMFPLTRDFLTVYESEVALAGGTTSLNVHSTAYNQPRCVGLIFGGENVRAASLAIGSEKSTTEEVEQRLMELKEKVEEWGECKQKIGFIFACSSRSEMLDGDDVETAIFRRVMPNIPLNGMFCMEVFGWDYPPPVSLQPAEQLASRNAALLFDTTTFAVIGFV